MPPNAIWQTLRGATRATTAGARMAAKGALSALEDEGPPAPVKFSMA